MRPWIALLALPLVACQTSEANPPPIAPDARAIIAAAKGQLYKDPDSIKGASITRPFRSTGVLPMWHVCVRANAKNSFGGYTGEKDMLIGIYDDPRPPTVVMSDGAGYCDLPHEPFPEIEAGYVPPKPGPTSAPK